MTKTRTILSLSLAALCTAAAAAPKAPADVDGARIRAADQEPGNWLSHGRTYDEIGRASCRERV